MGEKNASMTNMLLVLVIFGVLMIAKPMFSTLMESIQTKMQDTINSVDTGIKSGTQSFSLNQEYVDYLDGLMG